MLLEDRVINEIVANVLNRLQVEDGLGQEEITSSELGIFDLVDTLLKQPKVSKIAVHFHS